LSKDDPKHPGDFIRSIISADVVARKHGGRVVTRFPPEPNGHLHIGHAKSICLNFGIAEEFEGAVCRLRFDDTNPVTEEVEFVESMVEDVGWLGFEWDGDVRFTSSYFAQLHGYAEKLIDRGAAFVCELSSEEIAQRRGTLTEPGQPSPHRDRPVDENRELFSRMTAGEFEPGSRVLRAKIDMASPVLPMRDPILYRIQKTPHHRTGSEWCVYPMYDFAHCLSDSIEGVTHSLCTLEFVDHRPLYDWILEQVEAECHPQQIEFARLNLTHTIMSKRLLMRLVNEGHVSGWDDPRMPTVSGMRRRGYSARAIRKFCRSVGVAKRENLIELARLEHAVREDLNETAPRVMGVLHPLKVVIENYPEGQVEEFEAANNPRDESMGTRRVPFSRELYIDRNDFMETPPKKFFRMSPGREVRLRSAYLVTCVDVVKEEASGEPVELRCTYDPASRGGNSPDGRKVKGTLHWVSAPHALSAEVRLYEPLFSDENPSLEEGQDLASLLNPESLTVLASCQVEPGLADGPVGSVYQFEREGYFAVDPDSTKDALVFNRTVTLRDTWAKVDAKVSK